MSPSDASTRSADPWLIGAVIACVAGVVFLLTTDFGGWTEHTPFTPDYTDYWVGLDADDIPRYAYVLIVVPGAGFLYAAACAAAVLLGRSSAARRRLTGASRGAGLTAAGILAGGLLFLSQVSDEYDSWLDTGFYGSLSAAILAAVLLFRATRLIRETDAPAAKPIGSPDAAPSQPSAVVVSETATRPAPPVVTVDQTATHRNLRRSRRRTLPVLVAVALLGVTGVLVALVFSDRDSVSGAGGTTSASAVTVEGYVVLEDRTKTISVAVPADWTDVSIEPIDEGGETIPSISAAPDLAAYDSSWGAPGLKLRALPASAVGEADPSGIIRERARDWETGTCMKRYPEPATSAFATIVLVNCGLAGGDVPSEFHLFAMRAEGERYVRYLELNLPEAAPGDASGILATVPRSTKIHE